MNFFRVTAVAGLVLIAPHFAAATEVPVAGGDAPKVTVRYDDLQLTTAAGAQKLYSELRAASRHVCAAFEGRELSKVAAWKNCYHTALANAVAQVNRQEVTALYQHSTRAGRDS